MKGHLIDMKKRGYVVIPAGSGVLNIHCALYMGLIPAWTAYTGYEKEVLAQAHTI